MISSFLINKWVIKILDWFLGIPGLIILQSKIMPNIIFSELISSKDEKDGWIWI
jgi:hypothetical protein